MLLRPTSAPTGRRRFAPSEEGVTRLGDRWALTSRNVRGAAPSVDVRRFVQSGRPGGARRPGVIPVQLRPRASARAVQECIGAAAGGEVNAAAFLRARAAFARDLAASAAYVTGRVIVRPRTVRPGQDVSAVWLSELLAIAASVGIDAGLGPAERAVVLEHDTARIPSSLSAAAAAQVAAAGATQRSEDQALKTLRSTLPGAQLSPPSRALDEHASHVVQEAVNFVLDEHNLRAPPEVRYVHIK